MYFSFIANKTTDNIIAAIPNIILIVIGSLNIVMPMITLVIGSVVLKIDVFCAPIMAIPLWKKYTAPTEINSENNTKANHIIGLKLVTNVSRIILYTKSAADEIRHK